MTESELEHLALKWFQDTGWDYRAGLDIAPDSDAPERRDYRQVLLQSELRAALTLLNHQTPTAVLDEVAHQLAKPEHPSLIQSNRAFHEALVSGVSVEVEIAGERRGDRVQLVDFENPERNHFLVVSQFTVQGGKQLRRADLVCFINGLPLAVIEPKNPAAAQAGIKDAFRQLQTYKEEMSDLFVFNEALVVVTDRNDLDGQLFQTLWVRAACCASCRSRRATVKSYAPCWQGGRRAASSSQQCRSSRPTRGKKCSRCSRIATTSW